MLLKSFFYFMLLILPVTMQAMIIETSHVVDIIPYVDKDTLFLVDLDNTLFEAKQALGHANWFYDELRERQQKGMSREEAIRDTYPFWVKIQAVCPVKPLEDDFVPILLSMQNLGASVMALTHRQPSVADATVRQVASLGFDFTKTAPAKSSVNFLVRPGVPIEPEAPAPASSSSSIVQGIAASSPASAVEASSPFDTLPCVANPADSFVIPAATPTLYLQGILFVGDYNKKGDVFIPFLSLINQSPKKIVFIDDKRKNVEELEQALAGSGIEYIGVYYTAIDNVKPVYSKEIADFQYKFLNTIMSNEAATLLMKNSLE